MISLEGKNHIKRYLAGYVPAIGRSVAFGIGANAEASTDAKLQFEVGRSEVNLVSYDFVNNKLIFKAPVDRSFGGSIYEVALYSNSANEVAGQWDSRIITTFDSDFENWLDATTAVAATYTTANARVGGDSLSHTPAASGTKTDSMTDLFMDLSGYSAADRFVFAFNINNAFVSSMRYRFHTDVNNYYEFALPAQTTGYKIVEATKGSATVTGSPNWANINELRVSTSATAGGAASVDFDGIRIDDTDTYNQDYVMVSRELLPTPFLKVEGASQDIEFTLDVSV